MTLAFRNPAQGIRHEVDVTDIDAEGVAVAMYKAQQFFMRDRPEHEKIKTCEFQASRDVLMRLVLETPDLRKYHPVFQEWIDRFKDQILHNRIDKFLGWPVRVVSA